MDVFRNSSEFLAALQTQEAGFDIRDVVCNAVEASAPQAKARQLRLKRSVNTMLPPNLHGDSAGIGRLLTELVANAVQTTPHGEICLRADLEDETAAEVTVRFVVSSPFGKISADAMASFFERFGLSEEDAEPESRTDRGMASCRSLLDAVGGEMTVDQNPGVGANLHLVVSLMKAPSAESRAITLH
jgi:signal transduction histidine kinase